MWVYFPPRIVQVPHEHRDPNDVLNDAREAYLWQGIKIMGDEATMRNARKVIEYAHSFEDLRDPK